MTTTAIHRHPGEGAAPAPRLRRVLAWLWAGPNTLLGLGLGAMVWAMGGQVRRCGPALEFSGGRAGRWWAGTRLGQRFCAVTLGHAIVAVDAASLQRLRAHEWVHVHQTERWGPLFLPAYLISGAWQGLRGRGAYRGNPFEGQACSWAAQQAALARWGQADASAGDRHG
jgi:hypothetical protein